MNKKILFGLAALIPALALLGWVGLNETRLRSGEEFVLPITGYDPRDLLSGHYLRFQILYPSEEGDCPAYRGHCEYGRFVSRANINRYYIPEVDAEWLDEMLRKGERKADIVVVISSAGKVYLKDLRFDGKSWREYKP